MFKELSSKAYMVGGAVRDEIMGVSPSDYDYVLEANTVEFKKVFPENKAVGESFPVYLIDGNEVALTRTERSTGNGYGDFQLLGVGVPIKDDLGRRDFTINSIAKKCETQEIIDPFNGRLDISNQVIRTVNKKAFEEDPLRILRAIRFANRYNFTIEPMTRDLMYANYDRIKFLPKERIILELEKMWEKTQYPSQYFRLLRFFDLDKIIMPELTGINSYTWNKILDSLDTLKKQNGSFDEFIAVLSLAQNADEKCFFLMNPIPTRIASLGKSFVAFAYEFESDTRTDSSFIQMAMQTKREHKAIIKILEKISVMEPALLFAEYVFLCQYKFDNQDILRIQNSENKAKTKVRIYKDALEEFRK